MKPIFFVLSIILSAHASAAKDTSNTEPYSVAKEYAFSLKDIQQTVRSALYKADEAIKELSPQKLEMIADQYFQKYLTGIRSYNEIPPKTLNNIRAYKTNLVNAFVLKEFKEKYPNLIYDESKWMFNSVGGIYANMIILYCSMSEYVVLWGTTLPCEGKFSGYYSFMNEFDVMVRGKMFSHDLNPLGQSIVIYEPMIQDGAETDTVDTSNLIPGNQRSYSLGDHSYMVSYAQGDVWKAFFTGAIMPSIFVNQDWQGLKSHIKESFNSFLLRRQQDPSLVADIDNNPNYAPIKVLKEFQNNCQ